MESNGIEILMIVLSKINIALAAFLKGIFAVTLAVIIDSSMLITTTYIMIALNVLAGWTVALKNGTGWNGDKWFKTSMKVLWFPLVIAATQWIEHTNNLAIPLAALVAGFLTVHDFKGFIDNVGKLTGIDIWNAIADHVDWKKIFSKTK